MKLTFKILTIIVATTLTIMFYGCDVIPEDERTITMDEIIPQKKVLLLDFTDQACPNCPEAGILVLGMKEQYKENLVAVTLHSSPRPLPLVTPQANEYNNYFEISAHPAGVIDGDFLQNREQWEGLVRDKFNLIAPIEIELKASYNETSNEIEIETEFTSKKDINNVSYMLWILENNVVAMQLSGATYNYDYVHHHLFRTSVNETWGDDFTIANEETKSVEHKIAKSDIWKTENISIVGFVFDKNQNKVLGVDEVELIKE